MCRCPERFLHYLADDLEVLAQLHLLLVIESKHGPVPWGNAVLPREPRPSTCVGIAPNGDDDTAPLTKMKRGTLHD